MIRIAGVSKTFSVKDNKVEALKNVSLDIAKGDIYGIIGMSGAGKSTLVRCLNFLERPTEGTVYVEGQDLSTLDAKQLRQLRKHVAMIFQNFNLLMQRTVLDNVCFPMEIAGVDKKTAREKAREFLKVVELSDKRKHIGTAVRRTEAAVAIARALAMNPTILLCDEATSALDPTTTKSILALLKDINKNTALRS
ncbi:MAG: methionine ABC transporter ATP-binding protein [Gallintestinimicrobium sp.]